jgi:hypothetical protein
VGETTGEERQTGRRPEKGNAQPYGAENPEVPQPQHRKVEGKKEREGKEKVERTFFQAERREKPER